MFYFVIMVVALSVIDVNCFRSSTLLDQGKVDDDAFFFMDVEDTDINICHSSQIEQLHEPILSISEQWFDYEENRSTGRWFYGEKYRQNIRKRALKGNLGESEDEVRLSCVDRYGDDFVHRWRHQPLLPTGCQEISTVPSSLHSSISCMQQSFTKQTICILSNGQIDFRKVKTVQTCTTGESCLKREISEGFLHLTCPDNDTLTASHITSGLHLRSSSRPLECDMVYSDSIFLFTPHEILNLGHTLEDFMNIWLMHQVLNYQDKMSNRIVILVVDQLFEGLGRFNHDQSPFYEILETIFHDVLYTSKLKNKILCAHKIITFTNPRDRYPFIFNGLEYNIECSLKGPSPLYQRWNLLTRRAFGTFYALSKYQRSINILLVLRGNSTQQVHMQANREFSSKSRGELIDTIRNENVNINLTVTDLGMHSIRDQMNLVAENHILIGIVCDRTYIRRMSIFMDNTVYFFCRRNARSSNLNGIAHVHRCSRMLWSDRNIQFSH